MSRRPRLPSKWSMVTILGSDESPEHSYELDWLGKLTKKISHQPRRRMKDLLAPMSQAHAQTELHPPPQMDTVENTPMNRQLVPESDISFDEGFFIAYDFQEASAPVNDFSFDLDLTKFDLNLPSESSFWL